MESDAEVANAFQDDGIAIIISIVSIEVTRPIVRCEIVRSRSFGARTAAAYRASNIATAFTTVQIAATKTIVI